MGTHRNSWVAASNGNQLGFARISPDKEIRKLVRALERAGYLVTKGKKHLKVKDPNSGKQVVIASTPSDRRARLNMFRELERSLDVDPQLLP